MTLRKCFGHEAQMINQSFQEKAALISLDVVTPTGKIQPEVRERSLKRGGGFTRRESSSNFSADATCTKVDEKHMTGYLLTSYQIFMQSSF